MSAVASNETTLPGVDLDALAAKLAEKIQAPAPAPAYQLVGFTIIGHELRATIRTPGGDVFQGIVTRWERVTAVEVPK